MGAERVPDAGAARRARLGSARCRPPLSRWDGRRSMRFGGRWESQLHLCRNLIELDAGNDDGRAAHRGRQLAVELVGTIVGSTVRGLLVRLKSAGILEIGRNRRRWHTDEPSCIY